MTIQKAVSKKKGVTPMSFRFPTALVDEARAVAAADGITLTWFLVLALEARIAERNKKAVSYSRKAVRK